MSGDQPKPCRRALPASAGEVLASLVAHRVLSTAQVKALHYPHTGRSWSYQVLAGLRAHGLIDAVKGERTSHLWFATDTGTAAVTEGGDHGRRSRGVNRGAHAAGPLRAHTIALNDACIAFTKAARERGDECGPLSWQHEVAHRLPGKTRSGPGGLVIADALLSYLQVDEGRSVILHQRFVELDRGTIPVEQLAGKLARYALLRQTPPVTGPDWRERYRVFPEVLVVIAALSPQATVKRIQRVIALHRTDPQTQARSRMPASFTALADLAGEGPFAPIFISTATPGRYVDWLGQPNPTHDPEQER